MPKASAVAERSEGEQATGNVKQEAQVTEGSSFEETPEATERSAAEAAASERSEAIAPPVFSLSDLTPEQREELWENDDFKGRRAREQEGARQRFEAQLRRDAGKQERVAQVAQAVIAEAFAATGVEFDPDALDAKQRARLANAIGLPWNAALEVSAMELAEALPKALFSRYELPKEVIADALAKREGNDWDGYIEAVVNGAVRAQLGAVPLKDIPEGSALHKEIAAMVDRGVAEELKAREQEAARNGAPKPAPAVPRGGESNEPTYDDILKMTAAETASLPPGTVVRVVEAAAAAR